MLPSFREYFGSAASRQHSFGWAAQAAAETARAQVAELMRDRLKNGILSRLDKVPINRGTEHRLPHNLNLSFAGVNREALLMGLNDIAVSSGSACTSATRQPSYLLKALGLSDDVVQSG